MMRGLFMYLITLWIFEIDILNLIKQMETVVVYIFNVLLMIIVNMKYFTILFFITMQVFLEVLSN